MVTPYLSQQPVDDFGLRFSNLKFSASIASLTEETFTVPGDAPRYKAIFRTFGFGVYVALNETAEQPAGATFALTTSEQISLLALCREVKAGDVIHCYNSDPGSPIAVTVVLYALGTNN